MTREPVQELAVYLRTSLEDYGKSHQLVDQSCSIINQRKLIQEFISAHDELKALNEVEYIDDGFTGTNMDRPRFRDLVRSVEQGRVACIIIKDLSRLGRSYLEVGDYLEKVFPVHGVRVIAVTDRYDSKELAGMTGGMAVTFRNFIYDSYSKDLSLKVRSAMRTRMEKGKFVNHTPYGYIKSPADKHQLIPDPETAPIVQEIFSSILSGKTTSQVAKALNDRHVPTPLQHKQHKVKPACQGRELIWSHVTVLNILHNYKYTGAMINHTRESRCLRDGNQRRTGPDEWIVTEGAHEALVTKEEFEQANAVLRHPKKSDYQASASVDNVFYCGHCGRKLQKTHGKEIYFSCTAHKYISDVPCAGLRWTKRELEAVLLPVYRVQLNLLDAEVKGNSSDGTSSAAVFIKRMARLERDINNCDNQKIQLFEDYHDGAFGLEAYQARRSALSERRDRLYDERAALEEKYQQEVRRQDAIKKREEELCSYLPDEGITDEQLTGHMYRAIDRVLVLDDRHIEVRWKFDDLLSAERPQKQVV